VLAVAMTEVAKVALPTRKGKLEVPMSGCRAGRGLLLLGTWLAIVGAGAGQTANPSRPWPPVDENPQFFPTATFGSNRAIMARTYSWYLRSMGERPLAECVSAENPQVYRAVVLPPNRSPAVVRLSIGASGVGELVIKVAQTYTAPAVLAVNRTADVSQADVSAFLKVLNEGDFWRMPTHKPWDRTSGRPLVSMLGDTAWMLEGSKQGDYHLVDRGTSQLGTLKDSVLFLVINLAKVDLRSLPIDPVVRR